MILFRKVFDIQQWLKYHKSQNKSIGFVPTMGALHAGHISLIDKSKKENDITVCSIFVNPTQFNDPKDLEKYPRTLEADSKLLYNAHCDVLFYPDVEDIYPKGLKGVIVDLHGLDLVMEGAHRPGHFKGVVQVVHRLLEIVMPNRLYMGQKDFQQFTVIGSMIKGLNLPTQLRVCPILREPNGLAMSSRNVRLSAEHRVLAGNIYKSIAQALFLKDRMQPLEVSHHIFMELNKVPIQVEYVTIVDTQSLQTILEWRQSGSSVLCIAVWLEGVRLIDNIII